MQSAHLPSIIIAGLSRYEKSKIDTRKHRVVPTREQRIERLLNRYASAKLTWRKPETWGVWAKERDTMLVEARILVNSGKVPSPGDHIIYGWENDLSEETITNWNQQEYVYWQNNPSRPWNSGDDEFEEILLVNFVSFLAGKTCYKIFYDWS